MLGSDTNQFEHVVRFGIEGTAQSKRRTREICFPNRKAKAFILSCSTPNWQFVKVTGGASTSQFASMSTPLPRLFLSRHDSPDEHDEHRQVAFLSKPTFSSSIQCNNSVTFNSMTPIFVNRLSAKIHFFNLKNFASRHFFIDGRNLHKEINLYFQTH